MAAMAELLATPEALGPMASHSPAAIHQHFMSAKTEARVVPQGRLVPLSPAIAVLVVLMDTQSLATQTSNIPR